MDDVYKANKVVVGVAQKDGQVSATTAGIKVNGKDVTTATTPEGTKDLTVTISGEDILVGGESVHAEKTIDEAITDLSTAIDKIADNLITGEDALTPGTGTAANDDYVAVTATRNDENGNVTLGSSVLVATNTVDADIKDNNADVAGATPTGLATDAYVKNAIINALAWEVLD